MGQHPVKVRLGINTLTGQPDRGFPFMVFDEANERDPTTVEDQPRVLEQIPDGQTEGRFMAEWDGQKWIIGNLID
jgi:hypothetical protein